jgi:acyl carrier protein
MTKDEILKIIANTIEVDSVEESLQLNDDIWDSLAIIVFIAAINQDYGKILDPEGVFSAKTAKDLIDMSMQD